MEGEYNKGDTVDLGDGIVGTIKFKGKTKFARGEWFGVELWRGEGKHDGEVKGVRYFKTQRNKGVMVPVKRIVRKYGIKEATRLKKTIDREDASQIPRTTSNSSVLDDTEYTGDTGPAPKLQRKGSHRGSKSGSPNKPAERKGSLARSTTAHSTCSTVTAYDMAPAPERALSVASDTSLAERHRLDEKTIQKIFESLDNDRSKTIDFREFMTGLERLGLKWERDKAREAFAEMDEKRKGKINFEQFKAAIHLVSPKLSVFWNRLLYEHNPDADIDPDELVDEDDIVTMSPAEVHSKIKDTKAPWNERVSALRTLGELMIARKMKTQTLFDKGFKKFKNPLIAQLGDGRSTVVREASLALGKITKHKPKFIHKYLPAFTDAMYRNLRIQGINVIMYAAHQWFKVLVKYVPDNKKHQLIQHLVEGTRDPKFPVVRKNSYRYIAALINKAYHTGKPTDPLWWDRVENALKVGADDDNAEVRQVTMDAIVRLEIIYPLRAKRCYARLKSTTRKAFNQKREDYHFSNGVLPPEPASDASSLGERAKIGRTMAKHAKADGTLDTRSLHILLRDLKVPQEQKVADRISGLLDYDKSNRISQEAFLDWWIEDYKNMSHNALPSHSKSDRMLRHHGRAGSPKRAQTEAGPRLTAAQAKLRSRFTSAGLGHTAAEDQPDEIPGQEKRPSRDQSARASDSSSVKAGGVMAITLRLPEEFVSDDNLLEIQASLTVSSFRKQLASQLGTTAFNLFLEDGGRSKALDGDPRASLRGLGVHNQSLIVVRMDDEKESDELMQRAGRKQLKSTSGESYEIVQNNTPARAPKPLSSLAALSHYTMPAHDPALLQKFYTKVLGFKKTKPVKLGQPIKTKHVQLKGPGKVLLNIVQDKRFKPRSRHPQELPVVRSEHHLAFETEDLQRVERTLMSHAVTYAKFSSAAYEQVLFFDPYGNGVEIADRGRSRGTFGI